MSITSVNNEFLARIAAIPRDAVFECYSEALTEEMPTYLRMILSHEDLCKLVNFARAGNDVGAAAITMRASVTFADDDLRTDNDELEVQPQQLLGQSGFMYIARQDETDILITNTRITLDELVTRLEDAVAQERRQVWIDEDAPERLQEAIAALGDSIRVPVNGDASRPRA